MEKDKKLTKNFKYGEFWSNSKNGIRIEPPKEYFENIMKVAKELQIVRDLIKSPIIIISGYRTYEWNKYVGGAKNSYHKKGIAVDSRAIGLDIVKYALYLIKFTKFNGYGIYKKQNFVHADLRSKFTIFKY